MNIPGAWNCLESDGMTLHTAGPEGDGIAQFRTRQIPSVSNAVEPSHPLSYALQELSSYSIGFSGVIPPHLDFSPDCSRSAVVDIVTNVVTITDTANGKPLLQFTLAEGTSSFYAFGASSFSPDGTRFAIQGPENTAVVYDLTNGGQELLALQGHTAAVMTANFSPDGKQLATSSQDQTVKLWDAETGQLLHTFTGHNHYTGRVIFNPEATRLATGSLDRTVKVWDLETRKELYTLSGPVASVWGIVFSPDGKFIATGNNYQTLRLWDAITGEELLTLPIPAPSFQLFFTPDQTRLVVQTPGATHVYLPQIEDLLALAKSRVSRTLTTEECQKYLHVDECPAEP
jgi:WD40 repeat protein